MNKDFVLPPRRRFMLRERRRNAELEYARENWRAEAGLRMVHKLKEHNAEMRWLAELFALEKRWISDEVAEQRLGRWCTAHPDDARALRYFANVKRDDVLMEKAALMGDARAMAEICFSSCSDERKFQLACTSAENGDAVGTFRLMECFMDGISCKKNKSLAEALLERAADLGSFLAFDDLAWNRAMEPEQRVKYVVSFANIYCRVEDIHSDLEAVLLRYAREGSCGDVIFEVGEMLKGYINVEKRQVFGREQDSGFLEMVVRAVAMYDRWCDLVREACVAWVIIARRMRVHKDVRRMIAKMVWETRRWQAGRAEGI